MPNDYLIMLNIYHSNQLDVLKDLIAYLIEQQPLDNPMQKEIIVVQSSGMARWLQIELGQTLNILANTEFPLPATFIWRIFTQLLKTENQSTDTQYNKITMTWLLMRIIPTLLHKPEFLVLKTYLEDDSDKRKLHQLSGRCADLFDQYLVYRPDWMKAWEAGERIADLGEEQQWQAPLWQSIVQAFNTEFADNALGLGHRAELYEQLIDLLQSSDRPPDNLPQRFFICGIAALPPLYVKALEALGKHCDVHLMYTNPCQYYWADIQDLATKLKQRLRLPLHRFASNTNKALTVDNVSISNASINNTSINKILANKNGNQNSISPISEDLTQTHPLLANWGKLGRDQLYQFADLSHLQEIDAFVEYENSTLLNQVKNDLLKLDNPTILGITIDQLENSQAKRILDERDDSISFHVCHSALREVEVLHDNLLAKLAADPTLNIRDIVVMVADISAYAPYIQAVFGNAPKERHLPFSISDRAAKQLHPVIDAVSRLMLIGQERFEVESIIALLSVPALAQKFNIQESDLPLIEQWIKSANIYWGKDDAWMAQQSLTPTGQFTWRFGLDRLLLGLTKTEQSGVWNGIAPVEEALINPDLIGQLDAFIEALFNWQNFISHRYALAEWQTLFNQLIEQFFILDEADEALFLAMQEAWNEVIDAGLIINFSEPVVINILHQEWLLKIDNEKVSQRFLIGKINFCTLMPMRSVPFKVVCLLGMNEGVYPRTVAPVAFDLIAKHPKRGDRSRRDDDRYLFLEALLAAQQCLYISYVGLSIQNNAQLNPSILVNELLDYLAQSYVLESGLALSCDQSAKQLREYFLRVYPRVPYSHENYACLSDEASDAQISEKIAAENGVSENYGFKAPYVSFAKEWLPVINREVSQEQADNEAVSLTNQSFMLPLNLLKNELRAHFKAQTSSKHSTKSDTSTSNSKQQNNNHSFINLTALDLNQTINIELSDICRFYQNPIEYYFKNILGIYLQIEGEALVSDEPFALDSLEKYHIKNRFFNALIKQVPPEQTKAQMVAEGFLPVGITGQSLLKTAEKQSTVFYRALNELLGDLQQFNAEQESKTFHGAFDLPFLTQNVSLLLTGSLNIHQKYGLVEWRIGRLSAKHELQFWIKHLLFCYFFADQAAELASKKYSSTLVGFDDKKLALMSTKFNYLSQSDAETLLYILFENYLLGHYQPIWCLAPTCYLVASEINDANDKEEDEPSFDDLLSVAEVSFWGKGAFSSQTFELANPYINRIFEESTSNSQQPPQTASAQQSPAKPMSFSQITEEIIQYAKTIHLPMLENKND